MKTLAIVLLLLLSTNNFKTSKKQEYIEFNRVGSTLDNNRPLFISKTKLDIQLQDGELKEFNQMNHNHMPITKDQYLNTHYNLLITNDDIYSSILSFIRSHTEFYINTINYNHGDSNDMTILANGEMYTIFYKLKDKFFNELVKYLKSKDCDDKIIRALLRV